MSRWLKAGWPRSRRPRSGCLECPRAGSGLGEGGPGNAAGPILLAFLGALALSPGAAAQEDTTQVILSELGDRIEALRPRVEEAQRAAQRADARHADSVRQAHEIPLDTVQVGPLRVVTVPGQAELAREVFGEVWEIYRPLVRGSEDLLREHIFLFRYGWRFGGIHLEGDRIHDVEMNRRYGWDRLRSKARDALGHALVQSLSAEADSLRLWVGMTPITPPLDWSWIYRELASTPALAARKCYRGEVQWCWEALGASGEGGGWEEWYTPEERRLMVETRLESRSRLSPYYALELTREALLAHGCLELRSDRACLEILEAWPRRIPLGAAARASMVAEALAQGGDGAFSRLLRSPDTTLVGRLSLAAGLPPDTLAARWRERVVSARPRLHAGLLLIPLPLTFWILILLFFATRSTPWRLG